MVKTAAKRRWPFFAVSAAITIALLSIPAGAITAAAFGVVKGLLHRPTTPERVPQGGASAAIAAMGGVWLFFLFAFIGLAWSILFAAKIAGAAWISAICLPPVTFHFVSILTVWPRVTMLTVIEARRRERSGPG